MSSQHTAIAVTFENTNIFHHREYRCSSSIGKIGKQESRTLARNVRVTADGNARDRTSRSCKRMHCQTDETTKFSIFPHQGKPLYIIHDYHYNSGFQFIITQAGGTIYFTRLGIRQLRKLNMLVKTTAE